MRNCFVGPGNMHLHWHDPSLVVYPHQDAQQDVEKHPSGYPEPRLHPGQVNRCENQRNSGYEKASFLMGKDTEESHTRQGRDEGRCEGCSADEEEGRGWSEQLREVDEEVLVAWMYAMLSKVGRHGVVQEIIERRNDRMPK